MARTTEDILGLIRRTPFMWPDSIIHMFVSGSAMHGATGDKPGDLDIAGVYIQPPEMALGIPQKREIEDGGKWFDPDTQVWKSAGDHERSGPDDVDVSMYSLRKWAGMAASGNTTALEFLFVKNIIERPSIWPCVWEKHIVPNTEHFLSKRAGFHFTAFAAAMRLRLAGGHTGKHGQRPELEAEFGYDVKGAMHMLRVLGEGIELMQTGTITLPCREATFLKDIRRGVYSWKQIEAYADARFQILDEVREKSFLPDEINRAEISRIITEAQLDFWGFE
jgi:predicted nucleotidyltransferase